MRAIPLDPDVIREIVRTQMQATQMPDKITIGQKYSPAMEIREPAEATAYFERCVEHCMRQGKARAEAEAIERANLRYFAGYHSHETRERVERLFLGARGGRS